MSYNKNFIVTIPKGTIPVKSGGKTYIYHVVEKNYRKDKKNNSDVRVPVGIKIEDTNTMYINNNFLKYYKEEYEAKNSDEINTKKLMFSDGITYGQTAVIYKMSEKIGLTQILKNNFDIDENKNSNTLLNLASKFILTNNSSIISYPHFARNNIILGEEIESDTKIENILGSIEECDIDSFLSDWLTHTCKGRDLLLSIDGSNVQTEANDIEIVELGLSKNKLFENQYSLTLVTEQETYTPVYYKEYQGTTHDLQAAQVIINTITKANPKTINFVLDRGYFSKELMKKILKSGNGFIMMAKENKNIREIIDSVYSEIYDVDNYIPDLDLYGYTTVRKPFNNEDKSLFYHIYYSDYVKVECTKKIHSLVKELKEEALKLIGENKTDINVEKYNKYLNLIFIDDKLTKVETNKENVNNELKYSGYFVIISSYITSSEKAYNVYHNRDYTEKLIMMMKTFEQFDVVRCHDIKHLKAKNVCMFIGLILRNEIFIRTKELRKNTKDKKAFTTTEIIRELGCIQATKDSDGRYSNKSAYTKKEKAILQALDIQISSIEGMLTMFNRQFSIKR